MKTKSHKIKLQLLLLQAEASIESYEAPWLKKVEEVYRDARGRFATRPSDLDSDRESSEDELAASNIQQSSLAAWSQAKQQLLSFKDSLQVREGFNNFVSAGSDNIQNFVDAVFGEPAQQARENIANAIEPLGEKAAEYARQDPLADLKESFQNLVQKENTDKNIGDRLAQLYETAGNRYLQAIEDLENAEGNRVEQLAGKAMALTAPIGLSLSASLSPAIAIGKMRGDSLVKMLVDSATSLTWGMGLDRVIDPDNEENPISSSLRKMIISASATSGMLDLRKLKWQQYARSAEKAKKEAQRLLTQDAVPSLEEGKERMAFFTAGLYGEQDTYIESFQELATGFHEFFPQIAKTQWHGLTSAQRQFKATKPQEIQKAVDDRFGFDPEHPHPLRSILTGATEVWDEIKTFAKGAPENPDAVNLAAQISAYIQKNGEKAGKITAIGYSAGGAIQNEAMNILERMGVNLDNIEAINIGSPRVIANGAARRIKTVEGDVEPPSVSFAIPKTVDRWIAKHEEFMNTHIGLGAFELDMVLGGKSVKSIGETFKNTINAPENLFSVKVGDRNEQVNLLEKTKHKYSELQDVVVQAYEGEPRTIHEVMPRLRDFPTFLRQTKDTIKQVQQKATTSDETTANWTHLAHWLDGYMTQLVDNWGQAVEKKMIDEFDSREAMKSIMPLAKELRAFAKDSSMEWETYLPTTKEVVEQLADLLRL